MSTKLGFLCDVVAGNSCEDEHSIHHSPAFLARAAADATAAGVKLPLLHLNTTIIRRLVLALLKDGNHSVAIAAFDPSVQMSYGMCIVAEKSDHILRAQQAILPGLLQELIEHRDPGHANVIATTRALLSVMKDSEQCANVIKLQSLMAAETENIDDVRHAIHYYSGAEVPEGMANVFKTAVGRDLLLWARGIVARREVDAGLAIELVAVEELAVKSEKEVTDGLTTNADTATVNQTFAVRSVTRLAQRVRALDSKASESFKRSHDARIGTLLSKVENLTATLLRGKGKVTRAQTRNAR